VSFAGNVRSNQVIGADRYTGHAEGTVAASAPGNPAISVSRYVVIEGPLPHIVDAVTADRNANGYLDAIVIELDKPVNLATVDSATLAQGFLIADGTNGTWSVVRVEPRPGGTMFDSVFVLVLAEKVNGEPQTSWRPDVSYTPIAAGTGIGTAPAVEARDGAPPVIWSVIKIISETDDPMYDIIKVIYSEEVVSAQTGSAPALVDKSPDSLFVVYVKTETGFVAVPGVLRGLTELDLVTDTSLTGQTLTMVEFRMTNGNELYANNYLGIRTDPECLITDRALPQHNTPDPDNVPARVVPYGQPAFNPVVYPNPAPPSPVAGTQWQFVPGHSPASYAEGARTWVRTHPGFAVEALLTVPDVGCSHVIRVYRRWYDIVGNLVGAAFCPDLLSSMVARDPTLVLNPGETVLASWIWDGYNQRGMPVAPGVYREVIYLDYECADKDDERAVINYGVTRR